MILAQMIVLGAVAFAWGFYLGHQTGRGSGYRDGYRAACVWTRQMMQGALVRKPDPTIDRSGRIIDADITIDEIRRAGL